MNSCVTYKAVLMALGIQSLFVFVIVSICCYLYRHYEKFEEGGKIKIRTLDKNYYHNLKDDKNYYHTLIDLVAITRFYDKKVERLGIDFKTGFKEDKIKYFAYLGEHRPDFKKWINTYYPEFKVFFTENDIQKGDPHSLY